MKAYTYIEKGRFEFQDKPKPQLQDTKDAYSMFENKEDVGVYEKSPTHVGLRVGEDGFEPPKV